MRAPIANDALKRWATTGMSRFLASVLLGAAVMAARADELSQKWSEYYTVFSPTPLRFTPNVPLEPTVRSESPSGLLTAVVERTDGKKFGYENQIAHITVLKGGLPLRYLQSRYLRTVSLSWESDSVLLISRNIGRLVNIEERLDVDTGRWLSQYAVVFNPDD